MGHSTMKWTKTKHLKSNYCINRIYFVIESMHGSKKQTAIPIVANKYFRRTVTSLVLGLAEIKVIGS